MAAGDLTRESRSPGVHDELADLARSINSMATTLERSKGLEQQFLLSVSHDLRTPLTSIRGYAEAIADGTAPDSRAAADVILTESRRLERLVATSSISRGSSPYSSPSRSARWISPMSPPRPWTGSGRTRRRTASSSRWPETGAGVLVRADPDRLAQVVGNLVDNALKYARTQVTVRVTREHRRDLVVDSSRGQFEEVADQAFEAPASAG